VTKKKLGADGDDFSSHTEDYTFFYNFLQQFCNFGCLYIVGEQYTENQFSTS
jgi:uncharacterized protein YutD